MQYARAGIVKWLLENDAKVDDPMADGYTPLAVAAEVRPDETLPCGDAKCSLTVLLTGVMQGGHADVVKILLGKGANANNTMPDGETPMALAARVSAMQSTVKIAVINSPTTLLAGVMQGGHAEVVKILLNKDVYSDTNMNSNDDVSMISSPSDLSSLEDMESEQ